MNNRFTKLIQEYYLVSVFQGNEAGDAWLDKTLRSDEGLVAFKELVKEAVGQATKMLNEDISLEDMEAAMDELANLDEKELN